MKNKAAVCNRRNHRGDQRVPGDQRRARYRHCLRRVKGAQDGWWRRHSAAQEDEQKRQLTNYVVLTASPTSQEVISQRTPSRTLLSDSPFDRRGSPRRPRRTCTGRLSQRKSRTLSLAQDHQFPVWCATGIRSTRHLLTHCCWNGPIRAIGPLLRRASSRQSPMVDTLLLPRDDRRSQRDLWEGILLTWASLGQ